jgi:two-component system, OmpR family, alkaline phosphatase synthesis response regulator PhoP
MKILIVEDDPNLSVLIKAVISEISTDIHHIPNGWQAIDALNSHEFDLLILDVMLPGASGYEICRKVRNAGDNVPILMLTAKGEEDDKVTGLELGADDYLTKPFSNKELIARCKSLLRRSTTTRTIQNVEEGVLQIGDLVLNPSLRTLTKKGVEIDLTPKEYDLLYLMISQAGKSFSRLDLLERVWGDHFLGQEHTVNSNINRIRIKIEDDIAHPQYLLTVWGVGYKFATKI